METKELLELAAKACRLKYSDDYEELAGLWMSELIELFTAWAVDQGVQIE